MSITLWDWAIIGLMLVVIVGVAAYTKRYTKSVADFLAANRCAGRYLICISTGIAGMGAASMVGMFEKYYNAGFCAAWWQMMVMPVTLLVCLTGWVVYRYRETRAMTMAQFFEMRYGRRFRILMGIIAWVSGVLNYAIFPQVTANFITYFMGFPKYLKLTESVSIPTSAVIMFCMLTIAIYLTFSGGQIAVMVTDFIQGIFVNITLLIIAVLLIYKFGWFNITETLKTVPDGASMINPFKQSVDVVKDFGVFFFLMLLATRIYSAHAWQGKQGYAVSAKSPHEARMAFVIGEWRSMLYMFTLMIIPICAFVMLRDPVHAATAAQVNQTLSTLSADPQMAQQLIVPISLAHMLPVGLMGAFAVVILATTITTDDTCLHSWGGIFIQDVIMPFRSKPFDSKTHFRLLRYSIIGIAAFAFFWSLFFQLREYVLMYLQITGAIYLGGAGSVIIGGLYWRKGTKQAAWTSVLTGTTLASCGIILRNYWPDLTFLHPLFGDEFIYNGMEVGFFTAMVCVTVYAIVSLLTCKKDFDLNKMLHRDKPRDEPKETTLQVLGRRLGLSKDFTKGDKIIFFGQLVWSLGWFSVFLIGVAWNLTHDVSDDSWVTFWSVNLLLTLAMGAFTVVWFTWGGIKDLIYMFGKLRSAREDESDDGWVYEEDEKSEKNG